jgi:hypothetical protein
LVSVIVKQAYDLLRNFSVVLCHIVEWASNCLVESANADLMVMLKRVATSVDATTQSFLDEIF